MSIAEDHRHFLAGKTIVVAGGGIAGSAFVASLQKLWDPSLTPPQITIFERDVEDVSLQRQAYTLSLAGYDETGGLLALKKLDLLDQVLEQAVSGHDNVGSFKIWGPDWKEKVSFHREPVADLPTASLRIARRGLRRILQSSIEPRNIIRWESTCVSASRLDNGRIKVEVVRGPKRDKTEEVCDLLVVADGASSKLREFLRPQDRLRYSGAILRGGISRFEGPLPMPVQQDWGFMISGDGVSAFFSPVDQHSVVWTVGHLEKEEVLPLDRDSEQDAKANVYYARKLGSRFQDPFYTIVDRTDFSTVMCINARDKLPFAHENVEHLPVVYTGDSNHALTPFAGYGANLALVDGWDFAEQLCKAGVGTLGEAVAAYDALSVPRAARIVQASRERLRAGHSTGWRLWMFWLMLAVGRFVGRFVRKR